MKTLMKLNLTVVLIFLTIVCSSSELRDNQNEKTILITDLDYIPGSRRNVIPVINKALGQCAENEAVVIVFPKGRYDFWQDFSATSGRSFSIGFSMENLKNMVIDGDGSEFIFHGNMQIANISRCENIILKNFTVDWDFPFIYEGRYVNSTDEYIELEFDKEQYRYVIEDGKFFLTGEGWKAVPTGYFNLFDGDTKEILYNTHDGNNATLIKSNAEEITPGIVRFYGTPDIKPPKGTYTAFMAGRYMTTGISIVDSKDVYLKDLIIHHALSHAVVGSRTENITMDNANVQINQKKGRVTSIIADNSHFLNCKGLIKITNCVHTGAHDDFINVHGTYFKIDSIIGDNIVITSRLNSVVGDEVWFVNPILCQRSEVRIVKSIEQLKDRKTKITFESPLPKGLSAGDYMENKTWTPELEIRNCQILKQHRARGILVTTPKKVIIEDNYFRTAGTAILLEGDMDYWFESGANRDVTIRNNIFEDCLTSGNISGNRWEWGDAVITITPSHKPADIHTEPYHKNIVIQNNTFKVFDAPLVRVRSVRGLQFIDNEIIKTDTYKPYSWQKSAFLLDGCREVQIRKNKFDEKYITRDILIEHMRKSDVKVDKDQKMKLDFVKDMETYLN